MPLARQVLAASIAAFLAASSAPPASALPSECSACEVVAATLASRIAAEDGRTVLDMRGRLGPKAGQRKGKKLEWKSSETRLASLLDGICDKESLDAVYAFRKKDRKTVGLSVISKGDDDDDDEDDEEEEEEEEQREVRWLRKGDELEEGFTKVTETAEKEYREKELQGWCGTFVSRVEEGLSRELGTEKEAEGGESGDFDARAVLCERLSRSCAPSSREEKTSSEEEGKKGKKRWLGKQRDEL